LIFDKIIIVNINSASPKLLNAVIAINITAIKIIKPMLVVFHFINHTPTILNLDLSGYKTPCILNCFNSTWQPE
jgi:hypothetical protein